MDTKLFETQAERQIRENIQWSHGPGGDAEWYEDLDVLGGLTPEEALAAIGGPDGDPAYFDSYIAG